MPRSASISRAGTRAFGAEGTSGDRGRDYYLAGIDGLLYGDSPQEGYVRGQTFMHGQLGIRFDVPTGFQIDNKAEAVLATGPGDVAIRFDGIADTARKSLTDYIASGWVTGLQPDTIRPISVNGLEAATARASADRWDFDVTVVRIDNRIYRFLTAVPKGSRAGADGKPAARNVPQDDAGRSTVAEAAAHPRRRGQARRDDRHAVGPDDGYRPQARSVPADQRHAGDLDHQAGRPGEDHFRINANGAAPFSPTPSYVFVSKMRNRLPCPTRV